ncbi:MAG: NAD(P)/FAD-dependent oxidoreductase, partial [Pseudomonadota bacterium]
MQKLTHGLSNLEAAIARDFDYLNFPPASWVKQRLNQDDNPMLDVLIVGGGMCGMAANLALRRFGITNLRTIDASARGQEGPWLTYARMETLRSPKHLTGPALGLPNLTFRAWFEAQFGRQAWDELGRIPRTQWADYLEWYKDTTGVEVDNAKSLAELHLEDGFVRATIADQKTGEREVVPARRVVLATGRDALATPRIPEPFAQHMRQAVFHTSDAPLPEQFAGRQIVVIGLAASAFDYAAEALEAGAERVTILGRANRIPRINKAKQIVYPGFSQGFSTLSNEQRFEVFRYISSHGVPPPRDTVLRVTQHKNFELVLGAETLEIEQTIDGLNLQTTAGMFPAQVVVLGTGFKIDVAGTTFLTSVSNEIATWKDRVTADGRATELLNFPYLGPGFEFCSNGDANASTIQHIHCFNHAAMMSLGNLANDIPAVSEGAERLANAIATSFFVEDSTGHRADLEAYSDPELLGDEI